MGEKTDVYKFEFSDEDHLKMLNKAISLKSKSIISGYDNELYNDILSGWAKSERIALADGAKKRKEVLWISPKITNTQKLLF
jgi:DNA adenine methylase